MSDLYSKVHHHLFFLLRLPSFVFAPIVLIGNSFLLLQFYVRPDHRTHSPPSYFSPPSLACLLCFHSFLLFFIAIIVVGFRYPLFPVHQYLLTHLNFPLQSTPRINYTFLYIVQQILALLSKKTMLRRFRSHAFVACSSQVPTPYFLFTHPHQPSYVACWFFCTHSSSPFSLCVW